MSCGENYTIVLTEEGKIYSIGKGKTGVLGQANTKSLNDATIVEGVADKKVIRMSAGLTHFACIAIDKDEETTAQI